MAQTNYIKTVRINRYTANKNEDKYQFSLWLTPNDNSQPHRVRIDAVSISDKEGHHNYSVTFETGSYSSIRDMGGQENHYEYRWHDLVLNKDEYSMLIESPFFHFIISVGNDKEEHIIRMEVL